jgi:hypothetical protein
MYASLASAAKADFMGELEDGSVVIVSILKEPEETQLNRGYRCLIRTKVCRLSLLNPATCACHVACASVCTIRCAQHAQERDERLWLREDIRTWIPNHAHSYPSSKTLLKASPISRSVK